MTHPGGIGNVTFAVGGVDGLQIQITPNGARSWVLRTTIAGTRRNIGLGSYPSVTLAQARERARESRDLIWKGIDPVAQRRAARAALAAQNARDLTFAEAAERLLSTKEKEFRSERHAKIWRSSLDLYAIPTMGDMQVSEIERQDVLRALEPIWTTKTDTAKRLRQRIEAVLSWATVAGHREGENPARWKHNLDAFLPAASKVAKTKHWPALALDDTSDWFADLRGREGIATRALELLALTAVRSGDVRGAVWSEIDLSAKLWTIPADRMKAAKEHRVPLTAEAAALLEAVPRMQGVPYVFPAARGGMLSDAALSACMKRINEAREGGYLDRVSGRPAVPHGLRSTFRDWAAERTNYPRDMAEMALAHNVGTEVERAYRRGDMLEKRRQMMGAWQRFLRGEAGGKVVRIGEAG
ncbi:tyrosine-type recombinase/integrase [Roseovarius indicus]|uniref:Integrase n=1 Tax=Roseovarius indicus TaxID=540747 RepID=A0A0T5PD78_9RHOB|nr:integrase arm-type DNA-binding domain-containing protein [Roseovarius indicus]KRS19241.1 integrase [Roseovarius indicus]